MLVDLTLETKSSFGDEAVRRLSLSQAILKTRRARTVHIRGVEFGEPSWDLLLDLYVAFRTQRHVSVSSACIAANVPATTALRWITRLIESNHLRRTRDPSDARRAFLTITETAIADVERWLDTVLTDETALNRH